MYVIIWVSSSCMCGCMCARNRSLWVCGQWQKLFGSIIALLSGQLVYTWLDALQVAWLDVFLCLQLKNG